MFPILTDKLSFPKVADYWSREIHPPAPKDELLADLEKGWWLGEIGQAAFSRLQLLKHMFKFRENYKGLVFVTEDDAGPPITTEQPDGDVLVDPLPRVHVPSNAEEWDNDSCAVAFKTLADLPSIEHYPRIIPALRSIEITRDEFFKWLGDRGSDIPIFWGRRCDPPTSLKPAPDKEIARAIGDEYDDASASDAKPPNIRELVAPVQGRLKRLGFEASSTKIQEIGKRPEFGSRRWKIGKTRKGKGLTRSS
jgi:hypothetical protein